MIHPKAAIHGIIPLEAAVRITAAAMKIVVKLFFDASALILALEDDSYGIFKAYALSLNFPVLQTRAESFKLSGWTGKYGSS